MVRAFAAFAPVIVSDEDPAFAEVSARYGLEGFPTVVFTRKDGSEANRIVGAAPAAEFVSVAERAAAER